MNNTDYMTTSDGVSPLTWPVAQIRAFIYV